MNEVRGDVESFVTLYTNRKALLIESQNTNLIARSSNRQQLAVNYRRDVLMGDYRYFNYGLLGVGFKKCLAVEQELSLLLIAVLDVRELILTDA